MNLAVGAGSLLLRYSRLFNSLKNAAHAALVRESSDRNVVS
ncbi:Unknown protein sequence [Pseudomonas syringae pv. maculicola]|nr:Unknown protein sequence [Pseudomonas syringae pv. maculicola]